MVVAKRLCRISALSVNPCQLCVLNERTEPRHGIPGRYNVDWIKL